MQNLKYEIKCQTKTKKRMEIKIIVKSNTIVIDKTPVTNITIEKVKIEKGEKPALMERLSIEKNQLTELLENLYLINK